MTVPFTPTSPLILIPAPHCIKSRLHGVSVRRARNGAARFSSSQRIPSLCEGLEVQWDGFQTGILWTSDESSVNSHRPWSLQSGSVLGICHSSASWGLPSWRDPPCLTETIDMGVPHCPWLFFCVVSSQKTDDPSTVLHTPYSTFLHRTLSTDGAEPPPHSPRPPHRPGLKSFGRDGNMVRRMEINHEPFVPFFVRSISDAPVSMAGEVTACLGSSPGP